MLVNVSDILTRIRQMSNTESSTFVTDAEIVGYIDRAYRELYDILTTCYEVYNVSSYTFATTNGTDLYNLPADFYKIVGVDLNIDPNRSITLRPFMVSERNQYRSGLFSPIVPGVIYQYHLWGNQLRLIPNPASQGATLQVWYVPVPKTLVTTVSDPTTQASSVDIINGYDEFLDISCVIKILMKMEQATEAWERRMSEIKQNIIDTAANRDTGMPERVTDGNSQYWPYGPGSGTGIGY